VWSAFDEMQAKRGGGGGDAGGIGGRGPSYARLTRNICNARPPRFLAVLLANSLTYGRGNKEKLWELRRQAYGVILSALAAARAHLRCRRRSTLLRTCTATLKGVRPVGMQRRFWGHMRKASDRFADDLPDPFGSFHSISGRDLPQRASGGWNDIPPESHERFAWRAERMASEAGQRRPRSEMPFGAPLAPKFSTALWRGIGSPDLFGVCPRPPSAATGHFPQPH